MKLTHEERGFESEDRDEWRAKDPWRGDILRRMEVMEGQHTSLRIAVEANTALTTDIKKNTDDIVSFFDAARGTFKFFGVVSVCAKWITTVGAAMAAVWLVMRGDK